MGLTYPVPPSIIVKDNVPPAPTDALIVAANPVCPDSDTKTDTGVLYPDPQFPVSESPGVPIPIEIIDPPTPTVAVTEAPTRGAYPKPPLDPTDTIKPPLGSWFKLTSTSDTTIDPLVDVIPEKTTLDIPEIWSSCIIKLLFGLFSVVGVWYIPLIKTRPFDPLVPNPTTLLPLIDSE